MKTKFFVRQIIGPSIAILIFSYFSYHLVQGERGLLSWLRLRKKVTETELSLRHLQTEAESLEKKVSLLRSYNIDPDMLEERIRTILNFGYENELVVKDTE